MRNADIARVFTEIAQMMTVKGELVFKVRSYERAAEAIANLGEEAAELRARGGLKTIPGVGAGLSAKIEELLDTGKCALHQELLQEFPATAFEFLEIPGIGPKTVKLLLDRGITTIDELEHAATEGALRKIRGLGEKTEQEILRGIAHRREYSKRTTLGVAWDLAQEIMARIREGAPVDQIEAAGSLRRMQETIGDIDILVTSDQPEEFGAALQYFTGSKQHNVKLRELAVRKKLKLNEYGVFDISGESERRVGGRTEEEMYAALGLPTMPPEMREDQGEIEAAKAGKLPKLIEESDLRGDLHAHSNWSDGAESIEEMARAAKARGYEYLAMTDHSVSETVANGLSVERLQERLAALEAARKAV